MNQLSHFCYRLVELGYRAESELERTFERAFSIFGGPASDRTPGGEIDKTNTLGPLLDKLDNKRIQDVLHKMSATPMGSELVGYAHDIMQDGISLTRRDDGTGGEYKTYYGFGEKGLSGLVHRSIGLEARSSNDYLMSALAHELRHAHQSDVIGKIFQRGHIPPDAAIVINRFIEADAYTFQHKFCEDYAARTGDKGPLKASMKGFESFRPGVTEELAKAETDGARFEIWNNHLVGTCYDRMQLNELHGNKELRDSWPSAKKTMISPEVSDKLIIATARQIDTAWPLRPQAGVQQHYLSDYSDQKLTSPGMKRLPDNPALQSFMNSYKADYAAKHGVSAPKAAAAIQMSAPKAGGTRK